MKSELVAEQTIDMPIGPVRLTLARHDDGHYSGIAALLHTGQRIGMIESHTVNGVEKSGGARVDPAVAGPEVGAELERLLSQVTVAEARMAPLMAQLAAGDIDAAAF